jgi:hypothetical protein
VTSTAVDATSFVGVNLSSKIAAAESAEIILKVSHLHNYSELGKIRFAL